MDTDNPNHPFSTKYYGNGIIENSVLEKILKLPSHEMIKEFIKRAQIQEYQNLKIGKWKLVCYDENNKGICFITSPKDAIQLDETVTVDNIKQRCLEECDAKK